ncbi:hypothetical protein RhiirA4_452554 [Rhizophagus irregularis]|uniref:Uncharacterized protein n=1 Tax=Rhizophagus irregularis TaxID=588596 RepID=A0A2I1FYB6_9GLOM|nr:hypothetical protein RhiirA4_452554 [Rhizophagus irregularis]
MIASVEQEFDWNENHGLKNYSIQIIYISFRFNTKIGSLFIFLFPIYVKKNSWCHPAGIGCNPNSNNIISSRMLISNVSSVTNAKWLPD